MAEKEYIERDAAINAMVGLTIYKDAPSLNAAVEREYHNGREWIGGVRDALVELCDLPSANVVSRKHYLDALGTINEAHLHPERSAEIIDDFLKRYHALCMEEPNDRT